MSALRQTAVDRDVDLDLDVALRTSPISYGIPNQFGSASEMYGT